MMPSKVRYTTGAQNISPPSCFGTWAHSQVGHNEASVGLVLLIFERLLCSLPHSSPRAMLRGSMRQTSWRSWLTVPSMSERLPSQGHTTVCTGLRLQASFPSCQAGLWWQRDGHALQLSSMWPPVWLGSIFQKSGPYNSQPRDRRASHSPLMRWWPLLLV